MIRHLLLHNLKNHTSLLHKEMTERFIIHHLLKEILKEIIIGHLEIGIIKINNLKETTIIMKEEMTVDQQIEEIFLLEKEETILGIMIEETEITITSQEEETKDQKEINNNNNNNNNLKNKKNLNK